MTRSSRSLLNGHLWFSIITKPARSTFTRVQRLTCVLGILFTAMLANIWNFSNRALAGDDGEADALLVKVGSYSLTTYSLTMGIISALITIPVNILIVAIFSNRRLRVSKSAIETTDKYKVSEKELVIKSLEEMDEDEEIDKKMGNSGYLRYLRRWV